MKVLVALPFLILAVGCSEKESSGSGTGGSATVLEGTWSTGCLPADSVSFKKNLTVSGTTATQSMSLYSDAACTSEQVISRQTATIAIGSAATTPADATKIDFSNLKSFLTPKSNEYVTSLNSSPGFGNYGKTDWALNVEVDITGKTENGSAEPVKADYNIFKISGTKLCLGEQSNANDGSTDAKRPTTLATGTDCLSKQ